MYIIYYIKYIRFTVGLQIDLFYTISLDYARYNLTGNSNQFDLDIKTEYRFFISDMISNGSRMYRWFINFEAGWSERIGNLTTLPSRETLDKHFIYTILLHVSWVYF